MFLSINSFYFTENGEAPLLMGWVDNGGNGTVWEDSAEEMVFAGNFPPLEKFKKKLCCEIYTILFNIIYNR